MKAEIITIGDEILRGEIVDSNKARIAERLLMLDLDCRHQVSVLDDPEDMRDAFLRAAERSDVVLVSGGLALRHQEFSDPFEGFDYRIPSSCLSGT